MTHQPVAITAFVQEARELLVAMETVLLNMEFDGVDQAGIDAVFRAVHTIKGSASIFEFAHVVSFTHITEHVLDKVRNGTLRLDDVMRNVLLACNDYISSQIDNIEQDRKEPPSDIERRVLLEDKLSLYAADKAADKQSSVMAVPAKAKRSGAKKKSSVHSWPTETGLFSQTPYWYLSLRFDRHIFSYGFNPVAFVQRLSLLGRIVTLHVIDESLPSVKTMNPEYCYIGFELLFQSEATKGEIAGIFDLISDEGQITVISPYSDIGAYGAVLANFKKPGTGLALLKEMHVLDSEAFAVLSQRKSPHVKEKNGHQGEVFAVVNPLVKELKKVVTGTPRDSADSQFIKIEVDKLDQLIDLVGELVIASAGASLVAKIKRDERLQEVTQAVSDLVEKIRETALTFRMVKISEIFQRFPRVIREIGREIGKDVDLVVTGEETELDKFMMEKISNPLMHMVRNAIDHGIESTEVRVANGKDKKGTINLHARHESGSIVIEITDDGKGIDQKMVLEKSIEKGLVQDGHGLTRNDIFNLIFAPGFSTVDQVTSISGRGVGMDVVKKNIDQLHGKVTIASVEGQGTTMQIRLPLTLAIISGFQVIVGDMVFVLPLDAMVECINLAHYPVKNHSVILRDESITFISMRSLFDMPDRAMARTNMVVVQYAQYRIGLVVDELQGECQAVVKPLNKIFTKMQGLSGSAILADGRIALILDVAHLVEYVKEFEKSTLDVSEQRSR